MPDAVFEEYVEFDADGLSLEGVLTYPQDGAPRRAALILAPHPHFGGNMDNNVVLHLARGLARMDTVTLRFNYRGIGRSEGPPEAALRPYQYWDSLERECRYEELLPDVSGAWFALKRCVDASVPLAMVGYSLGAILGGMAAPALAPDGVAAVCPPTQRLYLASYDSLPQSKVFLHGDRDFAFDAGAFSVEYERMPEPRQRVLLKGTDHFLRKEEARLIPPLADWLATLDARGPRPLRGELGVRR